MYHLSIQLAICFCTCLCSCLYTGIRAILHKSSANEYIPSILWYLKFQEPNCSNLMIFLEKLIYNIFTFACRWTLTFVFPYLNLWIYFCTQHISSTWSQCSINHEDTYYEVSFCELHCLTPTHMPMQQNVHSWNNYF